MINTPRHISVITRISDRLDKALAASVPEEMALSRSRLQGLITDGAVAGPDGVLFDIKAKIPAGTALTVTLGAPVSVDLTPENIPLDIVFEDDHLLVVNKPAGMVVHPAPGVPSGTLVNAIMAHCGESLSGIGGEKRPGIVHRIDKDTSGLLVVAKSDAAHHGLAALFKAHDIDRVYRAFCYGQPDLSHARLQGLKGVHATGRKIRIEAPIGRHKTDRKKQGIRPDGRHAVTHITHEFTDAHGGVSAVSCQLETGRTHQIRIHMAHIGHPLLGDPLYGRARQLSGKAPPALREAIAALRGQALHAAVLGFIHPITRAPLRFEAPLPPVLAKLTEAMR